MGRRSAALAAMMVAMLLTGCSTWERVVGGGEAQANKPAAATPAPIHRVRGLQTATGSFVGASDHATTGHVGIFRSGNHWVVSFAEDFTFDGAPDPYVGLGNGGKIDKETLMSPLKNQNGAQLYVIPRDIDIGDYIEVHVHCLRFDVPLGVARLELL